METFMSAAMVLEVALLSLLLALWMTWMALRGLFQLMPATIHPSTTRIIQPMGARANGQPVNTGRRAA